MRAIFLLMLVASAVAGVGHGKELPQLKWVADKGHSSIQFRTSHWGIVDIIQPTVAYMVSVTCNIRLDYAE
ncbi:MAG: hypothetical protein OEN01_08035 [Candidatus Krumholzibacteria bacterium]|nr:hypothetical protein [Candidatus Krumholzibacteria bacterium]